MSAAEKRTIKPGFTLAEVLITLGIIGVVAAMTLPAMINKTQDKEFKVAYKKAYSSLSQAFLRMQAAEEYLDTSSVDDGTGTMTSPNIGENFKNIAKYFKATRTCFDNNASDCWELDEGEQACVSSEANNWVGCSNDEASYAFVDGSGMGWYLYSNVEFPVIVDVNGKKKPNKLGKDRFVMKFATSKNKNANYIESADMILPWADIIEKRRWCPSGNCMYQTWLLE